MSELSVTPRARQSLVSRLIKACAAVESIKKIGENDDYKWMRAADVTRAVRNEFFKRGLLLLPDDQSVEEKLFKNHAELVMRLVRLKTQFWVYDAKSDEKLGPFGAFGSGLDVGDKALYKAKTGALKYFILQTALLAEPGDDPEVDTHKDIKQHRSPETPKQKQRFAEYQVRTWTIETEKHGKTPQQCAGYLLHRFGVSEITLLSETEFDEAIRWVLGKADTEDTLKLSVHSIESAKKNGESKGA